MHANPASPQSLSFEDARHLVEEHAAKIRPRATEEVELLEGVNRVLAEPICADRDFPPFPRAARDGYAIRAAELAQVPAQFDVTAEIRAGADLESIPALAPGQTVAIMTGAAAPPSVDAVVMLEYTRRRGNRVEVLRGIQAGENIVARGSEARRGDLLVAPGSLLDEATIAVAASVGKARVRVYQKPTIAVLATADEIVDIEAQPGPTQIRNSNTYSLAAQILAAGAEPVRLPVAADQVIELRKLIGAEVRPGGTGFSRAWSRVLFYWRADSARKADRVWAGGRKVFLRASRQSSFNHGHLRVVRHTHSGGHVGPETAQAGF